MNPERLRLIANATELDQFFDDSPRQIVEEILEQRQ